LAINVHKGKDLECVKQEGFVNQQNRSWPALIGFFVATTLGWSLLLAAVLAGATVVVVAGGEPQSSDGTVHVSSQTFSGIITDEHCGPRHSDSQKGVAECARMCVRNGSRYTIVDGENKYEVAGNLAQFDEFAGQRVNLFGVLEGNTIKVVSINPVLVANRSKVTRSKTNIQSRYCPVRNLLTITSLIAYIDFSDGVGV
jgi:hypothetical protein